MTDGQLKRKFKVSVHVYVDELSDGLEVLRQLVDYVSADGPADALVQGETVGTVWVEDDGEEFVEVPDHEIVEMKQ